MGIELVKRTEAEIMVDIHRVYGRLSPECLSGDGELSLSQIQRQYTKLQKELSALEKELGRTVDESEVWGY